MAKTQKQIRTLVIGLFVFMLICICSALWLGYHVTHQSSDPAAHYRSYQIGESLYAVLHTQIKPGDTLSSIVTLLGEPKPDPDQADTLTFIQAKIIQGHEDQYPDGVQPTDQIYLYQARIPRLFKSDLYFPVAKLQFRDDILINFDPNEYKIFEGNKP